MTIFRCKMLPCWAGIALLCSCNSREPAFAPVPTAFTSVLNEDPNAPQFVSDFEQKIVAVSQQHGTLKLELAAAGFEHLDRQNGCDLWSLMRPYDRVVRGGSVGIEVLDCGADKQRTIKVANFGVAQS